MPILDQDPLMSEQERIEAERRAAALLGTGQPAAPPVLPPRTLPGTRILDTSGIAPGQSMSTGPGGPNIVGPAMSGREVLGRSDLTPEGRSFFERAEAGRDADRRNPIVAALGGPQSDYGESGVIPTAGQASSRLGRDLSPAEYIALLHGGSGVQQAQSGTQLDTLRLLGPGGTLSQGQSAIDANGIQRLYQTQLGAAYNQHMQNPANGRTAADRLRSWTQLGNPMPGYTLAGSQGGGLSGGVGGGAVPVGPGQTPASPVGINPFISGGAMPLPQPPAPAGPVANPLAPPLTPLPAQTTPGQTPIAQLGGHTTPSATPDAIMSAAHDEVAGAIGGRDQHGNAMPIQPARMNEAITRFVHGLGGAEFLRANYNQLIPFMNRTFGEQQMADWATRRFSRFGSLNSHERARDSLQAAARANGIDIGNSSRNDESGWLINLGRYLPFSRLVGGD